jgi:hypothetical protein
MGNIADVLNNVLCLDCVDEVIADNPTDETDREIIGIANQYFTAYCIENAA